MNARKARENDNSSANRPSTQTRVAIVAAYRTPFVKSFGDFETETPLNLSQRVVSETIARAGITAEDIGEVIWGAVIPQTKNPNLARDLVLFAGLPRTTPGYTLNRACSSSMQAIQNGADSIRMGRAELLIAGGVEVLSDVPITYSDEARRFLTRLSRTRTLSEKVALFKGLNPKAFLPVPPSLTEPFTGLTMGESAEVMAVKNNITRQRQDEFAVMSHTRAAEAVKSGYLKDEIITVWTKNGKSIENDNIIRADSTVESLSKIKPAFDKRHGTLTAGNSSALTDGAACVVLASEDYAKRNNLNILGYVVDSVAVGVDPQDQLLIGPALAIPKLMMRHGLKIEDVGVFELHEAFAAQALSCIDAMDNAEFCKEKLGLDKPFGRIPFEKLNLDGGSLAFGHPFGATGARLAGHTLRTARRLQSKYVVIGICAAGGLGQAMLLETT